MTISRRGILSGLAAAALAAVTAVAGLAVTGGETPAAPADDCCCIVQDGRLICTITGEELDECCCR